MVRLQIWTTQHRSPRDLPPRHLTNLPHFTVGARFPSLQSTGELLFLEQAREMVLDNIAQSRLCSIETHSFFQHRDKLSAEKAVRKPFVSFCSSRMCTSYLLHLTIHATNLEDRTGYEERLATFASAFNILGAFPSVMLLAFTNCYRACPESQDRPGRVSKPRDGSQFAALTPKAGYTYRLMQFIL